MFAPSGLDQLGRQPDQANRESQRGWEEQSSAGHSRLLLVKLHGEALEQ